MKKYLYLVGAIGTTLFSTSCKKDFTCSCTETSSNSSSANIQEITIKDARKTHAKAACVSREYTSTYSGTVYTYTCELK